MDGLEKTNSYKTHEEGKTIIIIGGLSAGPAAATKARRENDKARILLFEKSNNISYATCGIPYAIGGTIKSREKLLVTKPWLLENRFNIELHLNEEITAIEPGKKTVTSPKKSYEYDELIFATGASSIIPNLELEVNSGSQVKSLAELTNYSTVRTLEDFDRISQTLVSSGPMNISVLGGGLIGVEVAENLIQLGHKVTLIEGGDRILSPWSETFSYYAKAVLENNNVSVIENHLAKKIIAKDSKITVLQLSKNHIDKNRNESNENEKSQHNNIQTDYVFFCVGIRPNTKLLSDLGAKTIPNGALIVNEQMKTSLPNIYAAGDCVSLQNTLTKSQDYFPMGTHSNKAGRLAGMLSASAKSNSSDQWDGKNGNSYHGGYGTAIVKIFDHTLARTGLSPSQLKGLNYKKTYINAPAKASYYSAPEEMAIEVTYDDNNQKILSAEVFGTYGVDKRIDVLSTAIFASLKVTDLAKLDLAYAPPYSPAKDPIVVAGMVAENHIAHKCTPLTPQDFSNHFLFNEQVFVIDVRKPSEIEKLGKIPGSINIPLDDMRKRLSDIPSDKKVVLYCAKGIRGYLGTLILKHNKFNDVTNIAGGFKAWTMQGLPTELKSL